MSTIEIILLCYLASAITMRIILWDLTRKKEDREEFEKMLENAMPFLSITPKQFMNIICLTPILNTVLAIRLLLS